MNRWSDAAGPEREPAAGAFVLVVPWDLEHPGGVNQVVMNLYDELDGAAPGLPSLLVNRWARWRAWDGTIDGRRTRRWRFRDPFPGGNGLKAGLLFWAGLVPACAGLWWWLRRTRVRVVNAHYPGLWLLPFAVLRRLTGRPRVFLISLHGLDLRDAGASSGIRRRLWCWLLAAADRIPACSAALAGEARSAFPHVAARVEAIPNGVDPRGLQARARVPGVIAERLARGRRYIACVATFEAKKGQDVLLDAFAGLAHELPDLDLVLAGRDAGRLEGLRTRAEELGLGARVVFLPDLAHACAQGVIREAELFVLPSRYEPFGIVLLEAGVHGVAVVASRVGGVPEIIPDDRFGRLVPPGDPGALAQVLGDLLAHPDAARRLARNLERRVHRHFTWRRAAARYLELAGLARAAGATGAIAAGGGTG